MTQPRLAVSAVLAGLAVKDMTVSARWFSRVLGRSADSQPMDGLSEWHFGEAGTVQLVLDPQRAGGGLLTLRVEDLSAARSDLAERGIDLSVDDTTSSKVLFASLSDPDGNRVTLVETITDANATGPN